MLEGEARFRLLRELEVTTPYRQVEGELLPDAGDEVLSSAERASFEREARRFANAQGYSVDWESVERLDDALLVNGVSQIAPFDAAAKQALLEAADLRTRCELLVQLMQFFAQERSRREPGDAAVGATDPKLPRDPVDHVLRGERARAARRAGG